MREITYKILLEYGFIRRYNSNNQLVFTKSDYTVQLNNKVATIQLDNSEASNFDELKESYLKHTGKKLRRSYNERLTVDNKEE